MVPDRAARQLDAVADDVVLKRLDRERIAAVQRVQPALRHRERIVAEGDLVGLRIELVERKIGDPAEAVGVRLEQAELARQVAPQPVDRRASGSWPAPTRRTPRRRGLTPAASNTRSRRSSGQILRQRALWASRWRRCRRGRRGRAIRPGRRSCRRSSATGRRRPARGIARTTAPSSTARANTANSEPRKSSVTSAALIGLRRSGLSLPYIVIASS